VEKPVTRRALVLACLAAGVVGAGVAVSYLFVTPKTVTRSFSDVSGASGLASSVGDLSSSVDDLSSSVDDVSSTVDDVSGSVDDLSSSVDDVSSTVSNVCDQFTSIVY
jgi:methyl-accepting chemotaxis protein